MTGFVLRGVARRLWCQIVPVTTGHILIGGQGLLSPNRLHSAPEGDKHHMS